MKTKWKVVIAVLCSLIVVVIVGAGIMLNQGHSLSTGRYLQAENGDAMVVFNNSPIRMFNRTNRDLFAGLESGDEILVLHGAIAESYPGQTGVYEVFKVADGTMDDIPVNVIDELIKLGWLQVDITETPIGDPENMGFETTFSYANYARTEEVWLRCLNAEKMSIDSVQHLPIYKFDTLDDMRGFEEQFQNVLTLDHGYNDVPAFLESVEKYNKDFFAENTLMLIYVPANSGTYRYGVDSVFYDGNTFYVHVKQTNHPEAVTMDLAGWFITVAVPDRMLESCTEYDADLNID